LHLRLLRVLRSDQERHPEPEALALSALAKRKAAMSMLEVKRLERAMHF
jgi:hypothetical protein